MEHFKNILKKLKAHKREQCEQLLEEHVTYLCRVLKTSFDRINFQTFRAKINHFFEAETCPEVAINAAADLEIQTHCNKLGKEAEYYRLDSNRSVRVKALWARVAEILQEDPELSQFEIYPDLLEQEEDRNTYCPYCGALLIEIARESRGQHDDGTTNFYYFIKEINFCEHVLYEENCNDTNYNMEQWYHLVHELIEIESSGADMDFYWSQRKDIIEFMKEHKFDYTFVEDNVSAFSDRTVLLCVQNPQDLERMLKKEVEKYE